MMDGSTSPHLVPIGTPANGVNPIVVSIDFPSLIAHNDAPCPRWQFITFKSFLPRISDILFATYLCEIPWNPYFLIL